jgi:integrase
VASIRKRPDGKYRARYRDTDDKEHARHFDRKVDAQRWLDEVTASVVTGTYVDPKAGKETLRVYAERWREAQVHRPSTAELVEIVLRRHIYPTLGDRPLGSVLPSDVRGLVKAWSTSAAASTVETRYRILAAILRAAVADRRIAATPCVGIKLPRMTGTQVVPLETEVVQALEGAMPPRLRAMVPLAAGTGMRLGEVLGLSVDRVGFLRRTVTVDRQLVTVGGRAPTFGPPKTEASVRTIPLPSVVLDALAAHIAAYPGGQGGLLFTGAMNQPLRRHAFSMTWARASKAVGTDATFHDLRHYYASLLIRHGESVKTVQARLGHKTAAETLDTYAHLWPDGDDRTREAVDAVLGGANSERVADSLRARTRG